MSPRTGSYGAGYASDGTGNPAGTEGWSARGGWYAPGVEGESPHRRVAINAYIYDATVNAEGVSIAGTPTPMIFSGKKTDGIASSSASNSTRYPWMALSPTATGFFNRGLMGDLHATNKTLSGVPRTNTPTSLTTTGRDFSNSQYLVRLVFGRRRRPVNCASDAASCGRCCCSRLYWTKNMTRETSNTFSVSVVTVTAGNSTTYAYTGVVMPGDGQNSARAFDDTRSETE